MDEARAGILRESNKLLNKLHLHSVYFGEDAVYRIYLRTQVIHRLFENNPELDSSKLELFHVQYTASLLDLLKQIKKNNEQNAQILLDEIHLNQDLIRKMDDSVFTEQHFNQDKQKQTLKVNTSLRRLYQALSEDSGEFPFPKNIGSFSARFSKDFYHDVAPELLRELTDYDPATVYKNQYAMIQKKLLGTLCKYDFRSEFCYGLKAGNAIAEIFSIPDAGKHFLFYHPANLFVFCDLEAIPGLDASTPFSRQALLKQELQYANEKLESSLRLTKTYIPPEIKDLLAGHFRKISDVSFLQNMGNVDVQANILKTMLNTDSL